MGLFNKNKEPDMVEREDGLIDYDIYVLSRNEKIMYTTIAAIFLFALGYLFYHSIILSALLALLSVKFPKMMRGKIISKRKKELNLQFKEMLYSLSSSLSAGRSVESGLKECLNDLRIMYPDEDTYILRELEYIVRGIEMNETVENMLEQFAERSHLEDVMNFADIFRTCKRMGGDLVQVIKSTSQTIGEKIEIKQEIETTISGKRFEFLILLVVPVALIFLLTVTTYDYMAPVFETFVGHVVMTVTLALFGLAYVIGEKIMDINV